MKMEQIDTLIRALVKEPEQAQRESLGEVLREALILKRTLRRALARQTSRPFALEAVEVRDKHIQGPKQAQDAQKIKVERVRELRADGLTFREIRARCESEEITTHRGSTPSLSTISTWCEGVEPSQPVQRKARAPSTGKTKPPLNDTQPLLASTVIDLVRLGLSSREIAAELDKQGYMTSRGGSYQKTQILRIINRYKETVERERERKKLEDTAARDWLDMFNQPSMSQGLQPLEDEPPLDESAPDLSYSTRTEEEIRRDGFKLGHRFEREVFEFLRNVLSFCDVDQVSQNSKGKLKKYCDIQIVKLEFKPDLFGTNARVLIEAKSHKSEVIKPLDEIPRLPYQISELQKEVIGGEARAFVVCGRYTLLAPKMLEFENVLPHYTLDIYEIDPVRGAILTELDLDGVVKAIESTTPASVTA